MACHNVGWALPTETLRPCRIGAIRRSNVPCIGRQRLPYVPIFLLPKMFTIKNTKSISNDVERSGTSLVTKRRFVLHLRHSIFNSSASLHGYYIALLYQHFLCMCVTCVTTLKISCKLPTSHRLHLSVFFFNEFSAKFSHGLNTDFQKKRLSRNFHRKRRL